MAENVQTTETKQPGNQEYTEEVNTETGEGVKDEKHEYRVENNPEPIHPDSRIDLGQLIIRRNVMWAVGAGVLPLPLFDVVAITGVQVKMLKELSDLYGVPFRSDIAKKIVYSLLFGLGSVGVGAAVGSSLAKFVPGLGTTLGIVSVPIAAGAATHAVGKIFLMHFESGGSVLDFDPHAMRAHFKQEFKRSKETVTRMRQEEVKTEVNVAGARTI